MTRKVYTGKKILGQDIFLLFLIYFTKIIIFQFLLLFYTISFIHKTQIYGCISHKSAHHIIIYNSENDMLFQKYDIYENKLSEKLSDDNPYKKKLIEMETPRQKHPVYSALIFGLSAYCLIFLGVLLYHQTYGSSFSAINLIFVFGCIALTYKKDYLTGSNPKYRRNLYIIYFLIFLFSWIIAATDRGSASFEEILDLLLLKTINRKSYIALALIAYTALGISISFYNCPYELYRVFYSANNTHHYYKNEHKLIKRTMVLFFLYVIVYFPIVYKAFNPAKDSFDNTLKSFSLAVLSLGIPLCINIFIAKKYTSVFKKAAK